MPPFLGLYKGKPKTPTELVSKTQAALQLLATSGKDKELEKAGKDASEYVSLMVQCLLGHKAAANDKASAADVHATMSALLRSDTLPLMLSSLPKLAFESRKDVAEVFAFTCKYTHPPGTQPGLEYLRQRSHLVRQLVRGYEDASIALNCGEMVRVAVSRDGALATSVLNSECLDLFFQYVQKNALEATDAFNTFKTLLTTRKEVTTAFLVNGAHYEHFFKQYDDLLHSSNYATQRQALTLLATLLMDTFTGHEALLFKYIKSANNLMTIMNLLRAKSKGIQFEAFHVFKVFVANPNKPDMITGILVSNKEKLLRFLKHFLDERAQDDETFAAERADIMAEIEGLSQDPALRLRPSSSMHRHLTTSMSFSTLPEGGESTGRLPDNGAGGTAPLPSENVGSIGQFAEYGSTDEAQGL